MADNSDFHSAGEEQPEVAEPAIQEEGQEHVEVVVNDANAASEASSPSPIIDPIALSKLVKEVDDNKARFSGRDLTPEERAQKLDMIRNHYKAWNLP